LSPAIRPSAGAKVGEPSHSPAASTPTPLTIFCAHDPTKLPALTGLEKIMNTTVHYSARRAAVKATEKPGFGTKSLFSRRLKTFLQSGKPQS